MTESTGRRRVAERTALGLLLAGVGVLTVAAIFELLDVGSSKNVAAIDFDDVVAIGDASDSLGADQRPALRVAAGAMVSPEKTRRRYDELMHVVAERLDRRALLARRKTYAEINDLVEDRKVDVAFVCSAPYVAGRAMFGMELLVVPVMNGRTTYHSYTLAHRDSDVAFLDDLRGKVFAFSDPQSNSGCLALTHALRQRGETPQSFFGEFYFAYSHDNAIRAVATGMADGAAVDSLIWDYLNETDPTYTARTRIVEKSPPFGIPPVVVHPDLDPVFKRRLKQVFLTLHENAETRELLSTLRIDRFEAGNDEDYGSVREMWRLNARNGEQQR